MLTKNIEKGKRYLKSSFPAKYSNVSKFKNPFSKFCPVWQAWWNVSWKINYDRRWLWWMYWDIFLFKDVEEFVKEKGDNMIYDMCCYKRYQNIHKTSSLWCITEIGKIVISIYWWKSSILVKRLLSKSYSNKVSQRTKGILWKEGH